jgi:putative chitinase
VITVAVLIAAGIAPTQARLFVEPLGSACDRYQINKPARIAAFVAQAAHESQEFTRLEENLFYRSPERIRQVWPTRVRSMAEAAKLIRNPERLANCVYANRLGNGDESSGDGWQFRGRGLFQLTGRANYMAAGASIGNPYKTHPELVREPWHAALTAAWFWASIDGNNLADASLIDTLTRKINGPAMLAADERRSRFDEALRAFA